MRILLTGSSGMIGKALLSRFRESRHTVVRLVRSKAHRAADAVYWNPHTEEIDLDVLENFDAVVHLAGDNIFSRWSDEKKQSIFLSRCRDTWLLSQALVRLQKPPKVVFSASAIGFYGSRGGERVDEKSRRGTGFLADVCAKWEEATKVASDRGIRVVKGRFGPVLSPTGGILKQIIPIFRLGLGGRIGSGKQWMSWISLEDLVRGVEFLLTRDDLSGVFNFVAPDPVTNADFTRALAKAVHRPAFLLVPSFLLKIVLGEMAKEVLLSSARVFPNRLIESGFRFTFSSIDQVLSSDSSLRVV